MFCVRTIGMMWCVPIDRNAQDVPIQCHADELMCMIWCAMSFTFEHSGCPQVNRCMHHVLQWDWWTTPVKNAIKKPPTPCRAHEIMRMMYHDVMRWEPQQCFTVHILLHDSIWLQSIVKKRVCTTLFIWDHAHQRMCSRAQDYTTCKQTLSYQ